MKAVAAAGAAVAHEHVIGDVVSCHVNQTSFFALFKPL